MKTNESCFEFKPFCFIHVHRSTRSNCEMLCGNPPPKCQRVMCTCVCLCVCVCYYKHFWYPNTMMWRCSIVGGWWQEVGFSFCSALITLGLREVVNVVIAHQGKKTEKQKNKVARVTWQESSMEANKSGK